MMKKIKLLEVINDRLDFVDTVLINSDILKKEIKTRHEQNEVDGHIYRLRSEKKFLEWFREKLWS